MSKLFEEELREAERAHLAGEWMRAKAIYLEIIKVDEQHFEAWYLLGRCYSSECLYEEAIDAYFRAIDLISSHDFASDNGVKNSATSTRDEQLGLCYQNLADAYRDYGKTEEAEFCYVKSISYNPKATICINNRALLLFKHGLLEQSTELFEKAIAIELRQDADSLDFDLAVPKDLREAWKQQHYSQDKLSQIAIIANNLAGSYLSQGKVDQAAEYFRLSTDLDPSDDGVFSNWLMASLYMPSLDADAIQYRHDEWRARYCRNIKKPTYRNGRDPHRKLRIGYVSPDFRVHAVNSFFESFFRFHDTEAIESILYAEVKTQDEVGRRLESKALAWRRTCEMTSEALAQLILDDEIDILVDLCGHTSNNRLAAFTHYPAPVLVTYLGYPGQTALRSDAYCIVDKVLEPEEPTHDDRHRLRYLSPSFCCFHPNYEAPAIEELPALKNGYVTFGSLHGLSKLNGRVLDTWCEVLKALPSSKLFMFRNSIRGENLNALRREFERRGISDDRVALEGEFERFDTHLGLYDKIDITLDTFPWSGHTTCTESLWMGVPVITLYGDRHAGRMVSSVLTAIGCNQWIARTREEFIAKAIQLASDTIHLSAIRRTLRQRMQESPLCDGVGFARKLEKLYRDLWQEWLANESEQ